MEPSPKPLITVIIATYNASHTLTYAIKSLLDSDYDHFELLVIGDCCTDDTEKCVASFKDDRIHFYNLEKNSGQQSTPSNFGLKKAKGDYIAFLNQDDLYFPDHLSSCLNYIQKSGHQMICAPYVSIRPGSKEVLRKGDYNVRLFGSRADGSYTPLTFYVASSWFFEKSVIDLVGPWKIEYTTYETPSQEWLFRAWKKGISIGSVKKISLLILFTGSRKNFYQLRDATEHHFFYSRLKDPHFIAELFEKAAITSAADTLEFKYFQPVRSIRRAVFYPVYRLMKRIGVNPQAVKNLIRFREKGKTIKSYRKHTGLDDSN